MNDLASFPNVGHWWAVHSFDARFLKIKKIKRASYRISFTRIYHDDKVLSEGALGLASEVGVLAHRDEAVATLGAHALALLIHDRVAHLKLLVHLEAHLHGADLGLHAPTVDGAAVLDDQPGIKVIGHLVAQFTWNT